MTELKKENVCVGEQSVAAFSQAYCETDIIVPDTKPDILKIIQVDADASITDKSIRNEKLIIRGRVNLKILYLPDSQKEKISSINTVFGFEQEINCKNATENMNLLAVANVTRVDFSVTNSRKFYIKTVVGIDYEVCNKKEIAIATDITDEDRVQIKKERISVAEIADICEHNFMLQENIELPSGSKHICELLKVDTEITDCEYKTVTGRIIIKGTVTICVLYTTDENDIAHAEMEIPFTEVVDSNANDDAECEVIYDIINVICNCTEDSDGDRRVLNTEIEINANIKATENKTMDIISDCYVPMRKTELVNEKVLLDEIVASPESKNTLKEIVEFPDNMPQVRSIYNAVMKPYVTKSVCDRGKLLCEGKVDAYILYLSQSNDNPVYSLHREIPFSYVLSYDSDEDNLTARVRAEVEHSEYILNAAGEVELRCVLNIYADVVNEREMEIITDINVCDDETITHGICIYFVQPDDNLWDIAKNYGVSKELIKKYNDIEENHLKAGQKLFIPEG